MSSRLRWYVYALLIVGLATFWLWHNFSSEAPGIAAVVATDGEPLPDGAQRVAAPDALQASKWLAARTTRYRELLQGAKCDLLLLPVEVEESAFDAATRLLMSEDAALALRANHPCLIDPALVDLALGEGLRRHVPERIRELADELQAKTTVALWAGHDRQRHMRVTIRVSEGSNVRAHSFSDLSYDNSTSPFDAFDHNLPRMLQAMNLPAPKRTPAAAGKPAAELPASPRDLVALDGISTYERAARLTLLGILAPRNDSMAGDRLLAKALLMLIDADDSDAAVKQLRAHILLHMQQRPYALAALAGVQGPEKDALEALLNGDLPRAVEQTAKVGPLWERLFLTFELYDLQLDYDRNGTESATALLSALGPKWQALLAERRSDDDEWTVPNPIAIKQSLDEIFPLAGRSLRDVVQGSAIVGGDTTGFGLLPLKHLRQVLAEHGREWCCSKHTAAPSDWDLLDFYDGRTERSLGRYAYHFVSPQGQHQRALDVLSSFDSELAGEPIAETTRAAAEWYLQENDATNRTEHEQHFRAAARIAIVAAPGQTWPVDWSIWLLLKPKSEQFAHALGNVYCEDFPMRASWRGTADTTQARLDFSTSNVEPLEQTLQRTFGEPHQRAAAELEHRFIGNSKATELRLKEKAGSKQLDAPQLLAGIAADPDNWTLYARLANFYIDHGQFAEASSLVQSFPSFKKPAHNSVELSVEAYEFGRALYFLGEYEAAKPLLKIASSYDNGSAASIQSRALLALLAEDYTAAAMAFLEEAQHYQSASSYRDFLHLLFAGSESQTAWNAFDQVTQRLQGPQPWLAAVTGHRRDNISRADLRSWIVDHAHRGPKGDQSPPMYALMEQLIDRGDPPTDFVEFITTLAGPSDVHGNGGAVGFYGKLDAEQEHRVGPSMFGQQRRGAPSDGAVPNRFSLLAEAYGLLRAKRFEDAANAFDKLAGYYDIESDQEWGFAEPYFAIAATHSGDKLGLKAYLESRKQNPQAWGVLLARAIFAGMDGQIEESDQLLESAHRQRPNSKAWPTTTAYLYAEVCTWLYDATHDARYRQRALAWSRAYGKIAPYFAWPHALVARYSTDHTEQVHQLALALYLDAQSEWAHQTPAVLQEEAKRWLKTNVPFRLNPPGHST